MLRVVNPRTALELDLDRHLVEGACSEALGCAICDLRLLIGLLDDSVEGQNEFAQFQERISGNRRRGTSRWLSNV
jgi:hypothetical protein